MEVMSAASGTCVTTGRGVEWPRIAVPLHPPKIARIGLHGSGQTVPVGAHAKLQKLSKCACSGHPRVSPPPPNPILRFAFAMLQFHQEDPVANLGPCG